MFPLPRLVVLYQVSVLIAGARRGWIVLGFDRVYEKPPSDVPPERCVWFERIGDELRLEWQPAGGSPEETTVAPNQPARIPSQSATVTFVTVAGVELLHVRGQDHIELPLSGGTLGRADGCTARILHSHVSRVHARFTVIGPEAIHIIEEPEVSNPMTVNKVPTPIYALRLGEAPAVIAEVTLTVQAGVELLPPGE